MKKQEHLDAKKTLDGIILRLVLRNMEAGATIEKAKEQAFNRMNTEQPEILNFWLYYNN